MVAGFWLALHLLFTATVQQECPLSTLVSVTSEIGSMSTAASRFHVRHFK